MQNLLWIAGLLAIVFTFKFTAVALVVLAILIDGYFGAFNSVPYLSIAALCWYVCSELIRMRLRIMD